MAILKSALEEPLLSRQQVVVLRDIARAAQLNQGLMDIRRIEDALNSCKPSNGQARAIAPDLVKYLESEIERVLMQIKVPKQALGDQGKLKSD